MRKNPFGTMRAKLAVQSAMSQVQRTGTAADLDRAIEASQQALAAVPPEDPARAAILASLGAMLRARAERTGRRSTALSNLGIALRARFERTGRLPDLDRAIEAGAGNIYNVDASPVICHGGGPSGAHSDIAHPEIAHVFWQAALAGIANS